MKRSKFILIKILYLFSFHAYGENYYLHSMADTTDNPFKQEVVEHWLSFLYETGFDKQKNYWHADEIEEWGSRFFLADNIFQFPREHFFEVFSPYILSVECIEDNYCRIETSFEQKGFTLEDTIPPTENQNPMGIIEVGVLKADDGDLYLVNLFDERTAGYNSFTEGEIHYLADPNLTRNNDEIKKATAFADSIAEIFDTDYDSIRFVVCRDPKELGYITGFNFMFGGYTTGITYQDARTIISGLGKFNYPHELGHLIIDPVVGDVNHFFNEGLVTLFGGSGDRTYDELLQDFRAEYSSINRDKFEEINKYPGSPQAYTLGALFVEVIYDEGGVELLKSFEESVTKEPWEFIKLAADKMDMEKDELLNRVNSRLEEGE